MASAENFINHTVGRLEKLILLTIQWVGLKSYVTLNSFELLTFGSTKLSLMESSVFEQWVELRKIT